ncbi:MAG: class I SAM-dependent methyltransferase [Candidatus Nanohaloarchaea archaeon]|nr:class I SAM-dependent methyltransferase [Candidatus Nanohaloarchaea archaeon]
MQQVRPDEVVEEIWPLEQSDIEAGMESVAWDDPHETRPNRVSEMDLEEPIQYHADRVGAERVLEIGASSGATTEELAALLPDTEVLGVELSDEYVREAEQRRSGLDAEDAASWQVVQGRATDLAAAVDEPYDMVVALNSLGTLIDTEAVGRAALSRARNAGYDLTEPRDGVDGDVEFTDRLQSAAAHRYAADALESVGSVTAPGAPLVLADGGRYLVAEQRGSDWYAVESRDVVLERRQTGGAVQLDTYTTVEDHKEADAIYRVWLDLMDTSERSRQVPLQRGDT